MHCARQRHLGSTNCPASYVVTRPWAISPAFKQSLSSAWTIWVRLTASVRRLLKKPSRVYVCRRVCIRHSRHVKKSWVRSIPLLQVASKLWANIIDSDELVSHLVYSIWSHQCYRVRDEAIFLSHMSAGDLYSVYCTPFLMYSSTDCRMYLSHVYLCSWPSLFFVHLPCQGISRLIARSRPDLYLIAACMILLASLHSMAQRRCYVKCLKTLTWQRRVSPKSSSYEGSWLDIPVGWPIKAQDSFLGPLSRSSVTNIYFFRLPIKTWHGST